MSEFKHTSGPWMADIECDWDVSNYGESMWTGVGPANDDAVAIVVVDAAFRKEDLLNANARLIAAAPDLLDLAEVSYELASYANESKLTNQPEFMDGLFDRIAAFEKSYTAAIAKATGKEPV